MHTLHVSRVLGTGWEYRSHAQVNGLPMLHVSFGGFERGSHTGVAKGVFAVGDVAIGLVAFGGVAVAPLAFGGIAVGLVALGGLAVGLVALAGLAVGVVAAGALAVGVTAFGDVTLSAAAAPLLRRHRVGSRTQVVPTRLFDASGGDPPRRAR